MIGLVSICVSIGMLYMEVGENKEAGFCVYPASQSRIVDGGRTEAPCGVDRWMSR